MSISASQILLIIAHARQARAEIPNLCEEARAELYEELVDKMIRGLETIVKEGVRDVG